MSAVVVIADDLSGAAELAGIAFARGYTPEVQRGFDAASDADVIAVDTDSRGLSADAAAKRVEHVAKAVISAHPARIYKKVDSVLRGNVRTEIESVLRATGQSRAILVPANPSRGRTIEGGRMLIDSVPLDQTPFRRDPEHPRRTAVVSELLGATDVIDVPDVGDSADVARQAAAVDAKTLPAGAADFFAALLDARGAGQGRAVRSIATVAIRRPALLVCGSQAAWAVREAQCAAAGLPVLIVPGTGEFAHDAIDLGTDLLTHRSLLTLAIPPQTHEGLPHSELLSLLASLVAHLVKQTPIATILAEGGATAAAIAQRLAWTRFQVVQSAPAGVGVLEPIDAIAGPAFLIKPGSYPWPDEIWRQFIQA